MFYKVENYKVKQGLLVHSRHSGEHWLHLDGWIGILESTEGQPHREEYSTLAVSKINNIIISTIH
jgi:hypothetical protein